MNRDMDILGVFEHILISGVGIIPWILPFISFKHLGMKNKHIFGLRLGILTTNKILELLVSQMTGYRYDP